MKSTPQTTNIKNSKRDLTRRIEKTKTLTTKFSVRHFALLSYSKSTREEIWRWVGLESDERSSWEFVAGFRGWYQIPGLCSRLSFFGVDQAWVFVCEAGAPAENDGFTLGRKWIRTYRTLSLYHVVLLGPPRVFEFTVGKIFKRNAVV